MELLSRPEISVVVPVFNSEHSLEELVQEVQVCIGSSCRGFEIILVDDGSIDASWGGVSRLAARNPFVKGIRLERNFSQHNALLAGILSSAGDWILTIDDDLQHPLDAFAALRAVANETTVVYGSNFLQPSNGIGRHVLTLCTKIVFRTCLGIPNATTISAFRLFPGRFRRFAAHARGATISIDALLANAGLRPVSVEVGFRPRRHGVSQYSSRKLVRHALKSVLAFSQVPLKVAGILGGLMIVLSGLIFLYVIARALVEPSVPGFPFLAATVSFFAGVQLVLLGVQGLYVGEIHSLVSGQPPFVIAERTSDE